MLIGPGMDDIDGTEALLRELLRHEATRTSDQDDDGGHPAIVLDAYALGCLPKLVDDLAPWAGRLILTPNPTEAAILLGRDADLGDEEALAAAVVEIARRYQAVVSCQGLIARPPGGEAPEAAERWQITTGYGGLGTSGSGDILAGAIAGLRARGTTDAQATCWGTHLHAAAGDRLASRLGSLGFLARELSDELPPLMMELNT